MEDFKVSQQNDKVRFLVLLALREPSEETTVYSCYSVSDDRN